MTKTNFIFKNRVCQNSEKVILVPAGMWICCIEIAQLDNSLWIWSVSTSTDQQEGFASVHPCMIEDDNQCSSRNEAIVKATFFLEQKLAEYKKNFPQYSFSKLNKAIRMAKQLTQPQQLVLFS